ncbi:MAG: c-type cytochrome domain-containing protein, partial [Planctomycetaceae bacterium]
MKRRPIPVLPMLRLLVMLLAVITSPQTENAAAEPVGENVTEGEHLFVRRIAPLLAEKCLACHGNDGTDLKGELDLRNRAGLLKGGESGAGVVVPG